MLPIRIAVTVFALILALPAAVNAQGKIVDELKIGVLSHDVPFGGSNKETGVDINAEVLFTSPAFLKYIWNPRPHIGGSMNTSGDTNHGYFGLTWQWALARELLRKDDAITFAFSFGPAFHDGLLDTRRSDKKALGSRILFRESVEVGYQLTPIHSISGYVDHISNARLAKRNEGITNAGVRFGLKF